VSRLITAIFPVPEAQPADAAVPASAAAAD
jgi:hypothetical protein